MTLTMCPRLWEIAVPLMRSMAATAVSMALSTPRASSVPGTSLSMVAGMPTAFTPASTSAFALVRLPPPPMTTRPSTPASSSFRAARSCPSGSLTSLERPVPSTVPPRCMSPPSWLLSTGRRRSSRIPSKPSSIPTTSQPREKAACATARTAAFMPGATPPAVRTAIFTGISCLARTPARMMTLPGPLCRARWRLASIVRRNKGKRMVLQHKGDGSMAREDGGSEVVRLDDFEGEIEEELYIWEGPSTVHLIEVDGDERNFLIPSHAVTNVDDDGVKLELGKDKLMQSPEFESDDVPDPETRRAAFGYYGYPDPLDLGGG